MKAFLLTVAALAALNWNGFAQENNANYIEVSTRTEKQVTPDEIYLSVTLDESDSKGKVPLEKQERDMIKALQALGIDVEKDLTVQDMSSDLKTYFLRKNNILSSKDFTLKLTTARMMARVFDALNRLGVSDIRLQRTAVSDRLQMQVKDELLTSAARKAQENARILAEAVGSKAGKVIYMQNYYNFTQPYANGAMRSVKLMAAEAMDDAAEEALPSLEINKTVISVNVMCRFAIAE